MSEFLMVVPPGFTEVPDAEAWLNSVGLERVQSLVFETDWEPLSQILEDGGFIEPNVVITDARFIDAGNGVRFWFKV